MQKEAKRINLGTTLHLCILERLTGNGADDGLDGDVLDKAHGGEYQLLQVQASLD